MLTLLGMITYPLPAGMFEDDVCFFSGWDMLVPRQEERSWQVLNTQPIAHGSIPTTPNRLQTQTQTWRILVKVSFSETVNLNTWSQQEKTRPIFFQAQNQMVRSVLLLVSGRVHDEFTKSETWSPIIRGSNWISHHPAPFTSNQLTWKKRRYPQVQPEPMIFGGSAPPPWRIRKKRIPS